MSLKNYKKSLLICRVLAALFGIASLIFYRLLSREMASAVVSLTWATSNNMLFADVFKYFFFLMVGVVIYLQLAIRVKTYVERIEQLESEVEELKKNRYS